jgi:hypothetical protein
VPARHARFSLAGKPRPSIAAPQRVVYLPEFQMTDAQWKVSDSDKHGVLLLQYASQAGGFALSSPAGATESFQIWNHGTRLPL